MVVVVMWKYDFRPSVYNMFNCDRNYWWLLLMTGMDDVMCQMKCAFWLCTLRLCLCMRALISVHCFKYVFLGVYVGQRLTSLFIVGSA